MNATVWLVIGDLVGLSIVMAFAWWVQRQAGNSGWVDVIWTYGLGLAGVLIAILPVGDASRPRQILVAIAIGLWSLRLGTHVARRTMKIDDDPRYAKLKEGWGDSAQVKMFGFLQLQAIAAFLMSLGVLVAARAPGAELRLQDWLGFLIVLVSVFGEATADHQLKVFSQDPSNKGRICDIGLWRYSRHPNYFFEWLGWVGYLVIAADFTGGYWWGWVAAIGPIYMYYLLVYVSGLPPLEEHMAKSRPEAFAAYRERTNAFFPGPRKDPA